MMLRYKSSSRHPQAPILPCFTLSSPFHIQLRVQGFLRHYEITRSHTLGHLCSLTQGSAAVPVISPVSAPCSPSPHSSPDKSTIKAVLCQHDMLRSASRLASSFSAPPLRNTFSEFEQRVFFEHMWLWIYRFMRSGTDQIRSCAKKNKISNKHFHFLSPVDNFSLPLVLPVSGC